MIKSEFPECPLQRVGINLLKLKGKWYAIVTDYYSRFFEVALLENQKAQTVINHMKSIFSRHGIPETVRSDCGSQFSTTVETTREYELFSKKYGFSIVTSSPKYSQSNGFIESMVKNFKKHFEKSVDEDPYLMMLVLRTTPLENGYSPAELLMGRKLRTNLPMAEKSLMPKIPEADDIRKKELKYGVNQKNYYDKHHRV
ncbi:hypothetical protein AVEN_152806-1 [Araneus ventricosus]|uniref:Integrase catalytic domain-containing protein n=1 Tax=Araneus ventricosus TaxID=182803 RepID=A0A4Y2LH36_ARAVE|nr:hypothetical protein AVEN_152806-1 [Araneus ventricosus]